MAPRDPSQPENPLLEPSSLPYGAPPFAGLTAENFVDAFKEAIRAAERNIQAIVDNKKAPDFENTIEALEFSEQDLRRIGPIFNHLTATSNNDALKKAEKKIDALRTKYENGVMMNKALFARIEKVYAARAKLNLEPEEEMLLQTIYNDYVRDGALLDHAAQEEMGKINERLSELTTAYNNNIVEDTAAYQKIIDDEKDLAGVSERAKNLYKAAAEAAGLPGKWLIKLSPPPSDIFSYCENRALREEIHMALANIACSGKRDNRPLALEIAKLRHRSAQLLGYPNYAAYALDVRMAKTPEAVMKFLEKNLAVYKPANDEFRQKLKDFARATDGIEDLKPWDNGFYARKLMEKTFNIDMNELRSYFELEKVLQGLRLHAEKLFNITLTETKGKYPVYHSDVKVYEVKDKSSGDMIGIFYADYYARPGEKNNGAWHMALRKRGLENGENKFTINTNVCNFEKPTEDQPTLLTLGQVKTLFHEFGHGLHALLGEGNYPSLTCTTVKRDFVELPSQLQENWVTQKEVLDTFAVHYKTGQKIPQELIQKIEDMETFNAGGAGLSQTFLAMLDMAWYTTDPASIKSVEDFEDGIRAKTLPTPRVGGPMSATFTHIFSGGYAAGYYGYKWAEVLDADVFSAFEKNGLYDAATAKRLRETIYSKGGTVDPMELYTAMMGREPDPDAMFRREGLLNQKKAKHPSGPQL